MLAYSKSVSEPALMSGSFAFGQVSVSTVFCVIRLHFWCNFLPPPGVRDRDNTINYNWCFDLIYRSIRIFCHLNTCISNFHYIVIRACLDQVLIAIRLFTLLCDHNRSKTRLIAIMNLIAKLGIIYATACHASLYATALDWVSVVTAAAQCLLL